MHGAWLISNQKRQIGIFLSRTQYILERQNIIKKEK